MDRKSSRQSDRWVTPGVVCCAILTGGVLVLSVVAGMVYLTARGLDPDPMLRLVTQVTAAVGSLGTLLLQLAGRATTAKIERNTAPLYRLGRHSAPDTETAPPRSGE